MTMPEIDLPKLAGVAGSAVALIIASAILLSLLAGKYTPAFDRYRALAAELRGTEGQNRRRESVCRQVDLYRRRLLYMNSAVAMLNWLLICASVTILTASASILLPEVRVVSAVGSASLLASLGLVIASAGLSLRENQLDRQAIGADVMDLNEFNDEAHPPTTG
jgi:hypothetical protein